MNLKDYQNATIELKQFNEWSKEIRRKTASDALIKIIVTVIHAILILVAIIIYLNELYPGTFLREPKRLYLDPKPQLLIENL